MLRFKLNKRKDEKKITSRIEAIEAIAEEIGLDYEVKKNVLTLSGERTVRLEFISSNYAEKDEISLNANIQFVNDNELIEWHDLFHTVKALRGVRGVAGAPLVIKKGHDWYGSEMQKNAQKTFRPLFEVLTDTEKARLFLNGQSVSGLQLPPEDADFGYLIKYSKKVAQKLK